MPIYGYACKSCEHTFDVLQKMSDPRLVDCPECGEASLRKQLSAPKFRLKGQGWYETDFKTGDKRNIAGDADKKSDAKPDSKSKDSDKTTKKTEAKKPAVDSKAKSA
jgi:putative FmdB family regulatory protein